METDLLPSSATAVPAAEPSDAPPAQAVEPTRTVVVALFRPFSVRLILKTEIFEVLRSRRDLRIVILTPTPEAPQIEALGRFPNVVVERMDVEALRQASHANQFRNYLRLVRLFTYRESSGVPMVTRDVMLAEYYGVQIRPETGRVGRAVIRSTGVAARLLGRSRLLRSGWRALEKAIYYKATHDELFRRYRPDMLIVSSLGYSNDDPLIWEAQRHGVRVLAVIQSWDNTTNKGYPGSRVDHVIAWSEIMRREASQFLDVPDDRIFVGGVPHWDGYFREREVAGGRRAFASGLGMDPDKRILLFSVSSYKMYRENPRVARFIAEAVRDGRIAGPAQLLIRLHPAYFEAGGRKWGPVIARETEEFAALVREFPGIVFMDRPGIVKIGNSFDIDADEQTALKQRLLYSDVMINNYSTQAVEAAVMDLPIVNVAFGFYKHTDMPMSVLDRFNHFERVLACGGMRNARSEEELIAHVNTYLADRTLDADGRRRIVDQEVSVNRGTAGRAVGEHILSLLYGPSR